MIGDQQRRGIAPDMPRAGHRGCDAGCLSSCLRQVPPPCQPNTLGGNCLNDDDDDGGCDDDDLGVDVVDDVPQKNVCFNVGCVAFCFGQGVSRPTLCKRCGQSAPCLVPAASSERLSSDRDCASDAASPLLA